MSTLAPPATEKGGTGAAAPSVNALVPVRVRRLTEALGLPVFRFTLTNVAGEDELTVKESLQLFHSGSISRLASLQNFHPEFIRGSFTQFTFRDNGQPNGGKNESSTF